jgi:microsomal dipeptidase-like Zn-dependent dipeptidase
VILDHVGLGSDSDGAVMPHPMDRGVPAYQSMIRFPDNIPQLRPRDFGRRGLPASAYSPG